MPGQRGGDVDVDEGVELRVQPFNGGARVAHQILGGQAAAGHGLLQVGDAAPPEESGFDGKLRGSRVGLGHWEAPEGWAGLAGMRGPTPGRT
ncbi:hypothetical protein G6F45_014090 [Rhizopus arrhizus]|nr:hypothetical protein G6F45_014090 [Rhizopus arrhizus]